MDTKTVIENLAEEFVARPHDFVAEFDLQARLVEALRAQLRKEDALYARFSDDVSKRMKFEKTPIYKHPQLCLHKQRIKNSNPSRVLTEVVDKSVQITDCELVEDRSGDNSIDVVVMNDEWNNQIKWNDGSKRYSVSDFDAAIELKYIKNKYKYPNNKNAGEIEEKYPDNSEELIRDNIDWSENKIGSDLCELSQLRGTDTYLVIFSNYDYLYTTTTEGARSDIDISDEKDKRPHYVQMGEIVREELVEAANQPASGERSSTEILYANADHCCWLTDDPCDV